MMILWRNGLLMSAAMSFHQLLTPCRRTIWLTNILKYFVPRVSLKTFCFLLKNIAFLNIRWRLSTSTSNSVLCLTCKRNILWLNQVMSIRLLMKKSSQSTIERLFKTTFFSNLMWSSLIKKMEITIKKLWGF